MRTAPQNTEPLYDLLIMEPNPLYRSFGPWTQAGMWSGRTNKLTSNHGAEWMTRDLSEASREAELLCAKLPGKQVWVRDLSILGKVGVTSRQSCPVRWMWSHGVAINQDSPQFWLVEQKNRAECKEGWRKMEASRAAALNCFHPDPDPVLDLFGAVSANGGQA